MYNVNPMTMGKVWKKIANLISVAGYSVYLKAGRAEQYEQYACILYIYEFDCTVPTSF